MTDAIQTPTDVLIRSMEYAEELECGMFVGLTKDGKLLLIASGNGPDAVTRIGLFELAKTHFIKACTENDS